MQQGSPGTDFALRKKRGAGHACAARLISALRIHVNSAWVWGRSSLRKSWDRNSGAGWWQDKSRTKKSKWGEVSIHKSANNWQWKEKKHPHVNLPLPDLLYYFRQTHTHESATSARIWSFIKTHCSYMKINISVLSPIKKTEGRKPLKQEISQNNSGWSQIIIIIS